MVNILPEEEAKEIENQNFKSKSTEYRKSHSIPCNVWQNPAV